MAALDLGRFARLGFPRLRSERDTVRALMEPLKLRPPDIERSAGSLSGGNRQEVMLGRALTRDLKVFLVDEPGVGIRPALLLAVVVGVSLANHGVSDAVSRFSPALGGDVPRSPHVRLVANLQAHGIRPAMPICDAISSSDGVVADPAGFLAEAGLGAPLLSPACRTPTRRPCRRAPGRSARRSRRPPLP